MFAIFYKLFQKLAGKIIAMQFFYFFVGYSMVEYSFHSFINLSPHWSKINHTNNAYLNNIELRIRHA